MGGWYIDRCWVQSPSFSNSEHISIKKSMLSLQFCDQINLRLLMPGYKLYYSSACFLDNLWRHGISRSPHRGIRASPPCPRWWQRSDHHLLLVSLWKILLGLTFPKRLIIQGDDSSFLPLYSCGAEPQLCSWLQHDLPSQQKQILSQHQNGQVLKAISMAAEGKSKLTS